MVTEGDPDTERADVEETVTNTDMLVTERRNELSCVLWL